MSSRNTPKTPVTNAAYQVAVDDRGEAWARRFLVRTQPTEEKIQ